MSDIADELKALREEVAALRKDLAELRATTPRIHVNGAPQAPFGAFPVQPLPMPPYWYQPNLCVGENGTLVATQWMAGAPTYGPEN